MQLQCRHLGSPKQSQEIPEYNTCNKQFAWFHQFRTSRMRLKARRAWPAFNVQTAWPSLRASYVSIWRKKRGKTKYGQGMPRVFAILAGEAYDAILGFWVHLPWESDSLALESCHVAYIFQSLGLISKHVHRDNHEKSIQSAVPAQANHRNKEMLR